MNNPFNFEPVPLKNVANCGCQSRELEMDMREFELEEEARGGRRFSARGGGSRARSFRAPLRTMKKALRPPPGRLKPAWVRPPYRGRWLTGPVVEDHSHYREPSGVEPEPAPGTEHTRWVQDCLNQALGLQLPVTGVMGPETRSAVRSFQRKQGLRTSGIVGPDTQDALGRTCVARRSESEGEEGTFASLIGQQETDLEEEYRITSNCKIEIKFLQTINLANRSEWNTVPRMAGGVYVIRTEHLNTGRPRVENRVHYVGKEDRFVERFNSRYKVLRDMALDPEVLRGRTVHLYKVSSVGCSTVEHRQRHISSPRSWSRRAFSDRVARSIAEWALARFYGRGLPGGLPPGNVAIIEPIHVLAPARLEVILDGNRIFPLFS